MRTEVLKDLGEAVAIYPGQRAPRQIEFSPLTLRNLLRIKFENNVNN